MPKNTHGQENLSFTVNGASFNMIFVEGGTFTMGCTAEQGNCYEGERPAHKVTLTDYFIGEFQVTQKLWQAVMGTNIKQQWLKHQIADKEHLKKINAAVIALGGKPITITFDVTTLDGNNWFSAEDFMDAIPLNGTGDSFPVYFINHNECELFCNILNNLLADQLPEGYTF
ncbi:MAG: SUMF1/EgtB/PvdO family nonheme iron enzyme, partial [Lentimicrobiaceae bacterium]|nr:SUMF1/EgtB/PvdO family nonheme iron enzyme [Lentimicrobiaceae bacterium]